MTFKTHSFSRALGTSNTRLSSTSQVAIQNIRYTPLLGDQNDPSQTLNASPPSYCWGPDPAPGDGTVSELTVPDQNNPAGLQVAVWCSTAFDPTSQSTRVVTVSACLTSVVPTPSSGSPLNSVQSAAVSCVAHPGVQTIVTFDDYSAVQSDAYPSQVFPAAPGELRHRNDHQ